MIAVQSGFCLIFLEQQQLSSFPQLEPCERKLNRWLPFGDATELGPGSLTGFGGGSLAPGGHARDCGGLGVPMTGGGARLHPVRRGTGDDSGRRLLGRSR
jgi:hypothetical protein